MAVLTLCWGGLHGLGFPWPHYDDLFFAGTGISLATGHGLTNAWIEPWLQQFGSTQYFVQPPFHPVLLAGWLELAGISDQSLRLFANLAAWGASLGVLTLARRAELSQLLALGAALTATLWLLSRGLRPDGTALLFCALAALGWTGSGRLAWFLGSLCGAAAPLVQPFAAVLILPLLGWRLLAVARSGSRLADWRKTAGHAALALLAGLLILLLLIVVLPGSLGEFVQVFKNHARMRTDHGGQTWSVLANLMTDGWEPVRRWPVLVVLAAGLALALRLASTRSRGFIVAWLFLGFCLLGALLYAGYLIHSLYFAALTATLFLFPPLPAPARCKLGAGWIACATLMGAPDLIRTLLTPPVRINASAWQATLAEPLATPGHRLLLDEYTARYVYDWKLPANSLDWLHCHYLPLTPIIPMTVAAKPPTDVWLVDALKLDRHIDDSGVVAPRIQLGTYRTSLPAHPGDLRLVR